MKNLFSILLILFFQAVHAHSSEPFVHELSRQIDVIDYPDIKGYGTFPFKVFQPSGDWKCISKDGRLILSAVKKTTIEKQWDNDQLFQKMSFSYTNTHKSHIMLTIYVRGAKGRINIIREKLTGSGIWEKKFKTPHFIPNTKFNTPDAADDHYTADKITLRLHLAP